MTRPGGRVLLIAYGAPAEIEFLHFFVGALQAIDPGFAGLPATPPLEFQVSDPEVLRQRLADAGLKSVTVATLTEKLEFRSGQQLWNWVLNSNPIAGLLTAHLTPDQETDMRRVLDGMLPERSGGNGPAVLTNPVHIGIPDRYDSNGLSRRITDGAVTGTLEAGTPNALNPTCSCEQV